MTRRRYLSTWLQRRVAGEGPLSAVCSSPWRRERRAVPRTTKRTRKSPTAIRWVPAAELTTVQSAYSIAVGDLPTSSVSAPQLVPPIFSPNIKRVLPNLRERPPCNYNYSFADLMVHKGSSGVGSCCWG
eukprot:scaffold25404_cov30-Phaeocystis_antarctica.AAC.1